MTEVGRTSWTVVIDARGRAAIGRVEGDVTQMVVVAVDDDAGESEDYLLRLAVDAAAGASVAAAARRLLATMGAQGTGAPVVDAAVALLRVVAAAPDAVGNDTLDAWLGEPHPELRGGSPLLAIRRGQHERAAELLTRSPGRGARRRSLLHDEDPGESDE